MENNIIKYRNSDIHYLSFGTYKASHVLLTFSGYSDNARQFSVISPFFEAADYRIISLNLPFHGDTIWRENAFVYNDLRQIIFLILEKENIKNFECMGFSYGGRLILSFIEDFAMRIERVWLLAPEGLVSKWVGAAGNLPLWLRKYLVKWLDNPEKFLLFVAKLTKWGLIPVFTRNFLRYNLSSTHRRRRTFTFWLAHNEFKLKRLSHRLSLLPIEIFVGEKDELFPPHKMKKFLMPFTNVRLHLIAKVGHQVISAELVAYLQAQKNLFFRSEK